MLLTMQEAYKDANEHMPNEERMDKVKAMVNFIAIYRKLLFSQQDTPHPKY